MKPDAWTHPSHGGGEPRKAFRGQEGTHCPSHNTHTAEAFGASPCGWAHRHCLSVLVWQIATRDMGEGEQSVFTPSSPLSTACTRLHRPTPAPCNLAPWESDSSPSSFSFRLVPSCVQHALEDAKLSEALSPSLRSTPGQRLGCTRSLHNSPHKGSRATNILLWGTPR